MLRIQRITRAEYHWQPAQLLRRAWREIRRVRRLPDATVPLPWGYPITVDPRESLGRSIVALNVIDLPVTETIFRMLDPGETAADVGANIGYMTSVMAARLGSGGRILSFEPVPEIYESLHTNVARWINLTEARIELHSFALSDRDGSARIHLTPHFRENRGTASLLLDDAAPRDKVREISIDCKRLDEVARDVERFGLIKVDVEGAEPLVFRGAANLLSQRRIRDIVFEEHRPPPAESMQLLTEHGYALFRVLRSWNGPRLAPANLPPNDRDPVDPPTYLATLDANRALKRFAGRGWVAFSARRRVSPSMK
jgi:FkbM family methyltransferase